MAETPSHSTRERRGYRWTQRDLLLVGNTGLVCGIVAAGVVAIRSAMGTRIAISLVRFPLLCSGYLTPAVILI